MATPSTTDEPVEEPRGASGPDAGIKDTDIVFDCPHCDKSLAIDYRGAGLSIHCTDCGELVEVPIPEGMQITDLDSNEEEQENLIIALRRSLAAANGRIGELESEIEDVNERREQMERNQRERNFQFGHALKKVGHAESLLNEALQALGAIKDMGEKREP